MKLWSCFNFLGFVLTTCDCGNFSDRKFAIQSQRKLASAVAKLAVDVFSIDAATINLISPETCVTSQDFKDELLQQVFATQKLILRQETASKMRTIPGRRKRFVILLIASFTDFLEIYQKMSPKVFNFSGFYLIVLVDGKASELQNIFELFWKIQIFNVNIVSENESGTVLMETFMPFNDQSCNNVNSVIINQYRETKFVNQFESVFPDKMKSLNNCPVRVSISNNTKPFVIVKQSNNTLKFDGQDIKLITALSESLNFKIDYTFIGPVGYFYENGSAEGSLKVLIDSKADLSISYFLMKANRKKFFDSTTSYTSEPMNFVIPAGRDLTAFEKLVFPFSNAVWILIFACFTIGFLVIFIVAQTHAIVQNFVFGTGVKNSALNMFVGFIGGAQQVLPRRNFARFLLMSFLMYALVMRTLYQGSYYQLVQSNKRHNEVQSIDEMVRKDFKFYVPSGITDVFQGTQTIASR